MDQSQLKARPDEVKKREIAALLRERAGYERRLLASEGLRDEEDRAEAGADAQRRIDDVNAALRRLGHEGAAPAKRADKRPAVGRVQSR